MGELVRELGIEIGPYVLRQRTDGLVVLVHDRQPHDGSISGIAMTKESAEKMAHDLVSKGGPLIILGQSEVAKVEAQAERRRREASQRRTG